MLELCELISHYGEPLFSEKEKPNDPRKVISFGDLFTVSTIHKRSSNINGKIHMNCIYSYTQLFPINWWECC